MSFSIGSRRLRFSRRYLTRIRTTRDAFDTCRDVNRVLLLAIEPPRNLIVAVAKNTFTLELFIKFYKNYIVQKSY